MTDAVALYEVRAVVEALAGRLFAERPRAFRQRLVALWQGGKDTA